MERNDTFSSANIKRVRMKLTWAQLEVVSTKGDDFHLIIAGDDESVEELRIEQGSQDLTVAQPQLGYAKEILPRRRWMQICLRMPEKWRGDLDADSVAGTIGAHGIDAGDISLTTVSASLNVQDVQGSMLYLHTVSGTIAGSVLRARRGNLRSISGDISITDATFEATKVFTISGKVLLGLNMGSHAVDTQSVSGSLCVETDSPVKASLHSLSGQFLRDDAVPQSGDSLLEITASSVSGDLAVRKRNPK